MVNFFTTGIPRTLISRSGCQGIENDDDDFDFEREIILSQSVKDALEKSKEILALEEIYSHNLKNLQNKNSYQRHSPVAKVFSDTAEILELATEKLERIKGKRRSRRATPSFSRRSQSLVRIKVQEASGPDRELKELLGRCHLNESVSCSEMSRYRTYSGACNSLALPALGASLTELARLLPAEYHDGISQPRSYSVTRSPLPNPRAVSTTILERLESLDPQYNLMVMQWGQFIDHDFALVPQYRGTRLSGCQY